MSATCRCGAWVGHPEARSCTIPDCELRGMTPAAQADASLAPPLGGASAVIADLTRVKVLFQQRAIVAHLGFHPCVQVDAA